MIPAVLPSGADSRVFRVKSRFLHPCPSVKSVVRKRFSVFCAQAAKRGSVAGSIVSALFRTGKAAISRELSGILERIGSSAESWWARLEKLSRGRLLGRFFAATRERLREVARSLGVHHLANLGGCPAR